jgi:polyketide cyclase/dehydrase/lipid transport protein
VIVNVCPAATSEAPPDRIWSVMTAPERVGEWNDASYVKSEPPGPVQPGQVIYLTAPAFGRRWPLTFRIEGLDPGRRWADLLVKLPFGIENHEHITLTPTPEGGTLVRFN